MKVHATFFRFGGEQLLRVPYKPLLELELNMAAPVQTARTGPPPHPQPLTDFSIQPHHLQVLHILRSIFHTFSEAGLPAEFVIHVNRVLLEVVAEVRQTFLK